MSAEDPSRSLISQQHNRSFTRRGGRMPERHHRALRMHRESYVLELPDLLTGRAGTPESFWDPEQSYGRRAPLIVEVGSGSGDCVVAAAAADPERDYLAMEVWRPGVAQTIAKAVHAGVRNLKVVEADAAEALALLCPPGSLEEVWTFFPDPWPKRKHHKRRLVSAEFAETVVGVLRPGGSWRLATDWADYAWQIRDVGERTRGLRTVHPGRLADPRDPARDPRGAHGGFAPRFEARAQTRFETKGLRQDRVIRDLHFRTVQ